MNYVIGTRGSKLALAQTEYVKKRLEEYYKDDTFEIKVIHTTGDKNKTQALESIGSKGIFTDEIEKQLLEGDIDFAVHSMKDMPGEIDERLTFSKAWDREDPRDVLILKDAESLIKLQEGAVIGTGSKRRAYQLKQLRPDINVVNIRGNVDTRIKKLMNPDEGLDGIVIAAAGLKRLGRENEITQFLSPEEMIPAPAQGILAIETRKDNTVLLDKLNALANEEVNYAAKLEREFLTLTGGDCHHPIGAYYDCNGTFYALFGRQDGSRIVSIKRESINKDTDITAIVGDIVKKIKKQLNEE